MISRKSEYNCNILVDTMYFACVCDCLLQCIEVIDLTYISNYLLVIGYVQFCYFMAPNKYKSFRQY